MYYIDFFVSRSDFYKQPFPNIGLKSIEEFFSERNEMQKVGLTSDDNIHQQIMTNEQYLQDPNKIEAQKQIQMANQGLLEELNDSFADSYVDSQNLNKKSIFLKGAKIVKQLVGKILHFRNNNRMQSKKRKDIKCTCKKNQCCNLYCGCYQIQKHCTKSCKCNKIECHNMPNTSSQYQQLR
ncbi:unnamed protein product (macronuclear) [Paramecium tetraurelia]|uniref:CRC domain-containing protein n=1 Tax=Paramecium tetraurelia TaxID=5888 RepID=A0CE72_PARTE|nr:uncharacterized protein GSPATT00037525001 [Paramecium tetraurelia]CAK69089.1 unnamed protein product [Paramecium tetraurelia]|eukprot:XP_001436486.1 hypothetical protein (macronuclear) [Paramecium tetraurelia strain d4-2]